MQPPIKSGILLGDRYGELTIIDYVGSPKWEYTCQCSCGKTTKKRLKYLKTAQVANCGCLTRLGWRAENAEYAVKNRVLDRYKQNAKRRNIAWEIPDKHFFFLINSPCHYCTQVGSMCGDRKRLSYDSASIRFNGLDRKDNAIAYTVDNTVTCCDVCNRAKGTMPYEEFIEWTKRFKS